MIADILHNLNLFVDGRGYAGKVEEFKPPKIAVKTEEFHAGGMAAPVDVPMGTFEKLEAEGTLLAFDADVLLTLNVIPGVQVACTLRGTIAGEDGVQKPVVVTLRGKLIEADQDAWKPGAKAALKLKWSLHYYKLELNSRVIYEIDPINYVAVIGGVDQLATARQHLGI